MVGKRPLNPDPGTCPKPVQMLGGVMCVYKMVTGCSRAQYYYLKVVSGNKCILHGQALFLFPNISEAFSSFI